jgi:hypothetical protein
VKERLDASATRRVISSRLRLAAASKGVSLPRVSTAIVPLRLLQEGIESASEGGLEHGLGEFGVLIHHDEPGRYLRQARMRVAARASMANAPASWVRSSAGVMARRAMHGAQGSGFYGAFPPHVQTRAQAIRPECSRLPNDYA